MLLFSLENGVEEVGDNFRQWRGFGQGRVWAPRVTRWMVEDLILDAAMDGPTCLRGGLVVEGEAAWAVVYADLLMAFPS